MNARRVAPLLVLFLAGCATPPLHSKTSASQSGQVNESAASSSSAAPVTRRVALPYTFTRRGVEIRVNSIESANGQVLVSVTLQETKGQSADLLVSTLTQVVTAAGHSLPYMQYSRGDKTDKDPAIHLTAHEQFSITLIYQAEAGSSDASIRSMELRFPTGKFWNSKVAD